jgi:nitrite reductase (NO-forming)
LFNNNGGKTEIFIYCLLLYIKFKITKNQILNPMKKSIFLTLSILIAGSTMFFIGSGFTTASKIVNSDIEVVAVDPGLAQDAAQMKRGEEIYKEKCIICHMADGKGIPGAFPPLAQSDYLLADKVRAVSQVLNGSNEPMVVNGITYTAPMTPQVDTKEDAVAVINYVLNNFGNDGGYVTMEDVKDVKIEPRD